MDKLISIKDVLNLFENKPPILLGNGFSINFHNEFRYDKLINKIKPKCSSTLQTLIDKSTFHNIEDILLKLQTYIEVSELINHEYQKVENLYNELKSNFISVISEIQPSKGFYPTNSSGIQEDLDLFSKIFTTNYDLSLFFVTISMGTFTDKFGQHSLTNNPTFDSNNHKEYEGVIYYLHGNLMFYDETVLFYDDDYIKLTSKLVRSKGIQLLDVIKSSIEGGKYPIIVTEGNSLYKLEKINRNSYLKYCWDSFNINESKELVIFGHSLGNSDKHIVDLIQNNYTKIYYGIYENSGIEQSQIKSLFNNIEIIFYDSKELFSDTDTLPF